MATGKESNDGNRFIEDPGVIRQNPESTETCPQPTSLPVTSNYPTVLAVPSFPPVKSNTSTAVTQSADNSTRIATWSSSPRKFAQSSSDILAISNTNKLLPMTSNPKSETSQPQKYNLHTASEKVGPVLQQVTEQGSKVLSAAQHKNIRTTSSNFVAVSQPSTSTYSSSRPVQGLNLQDSKFFYSSHQKNIASDAGNRVPVSATNVSELSGSNIVPVLQQNISHSSGSKVVPTRHGFTSDSESLNLTLGQKVTEKVISSSLFGVISKQNTNAKTPEISNAGKATTVSSSTSDYKIAHPIGSRKVTENVITYHEPMFQSVANTLFENQKNLMMGKRKAEDERVKGESVFQDCKRSRFEINASPNKSVDSKTTVIKKKSIENIIERIRTEKTLSRGGSGQVMKVNEEEKVKCNAGSIPSENIKTETNILQIDNTHSVETEKSESLGNKLKSEVNKQTSSQKCDGDKKSEDEKPSNGFKVDQLESECITVDKSETKEETKEETQNDQFLKKTTDNSQKPKKFNSSSPKSKKAKGLLKVKTPETSPTKLKTPEKSLSKLKTPENSPSKLKSPEGSPPKLKTPENSPSKLKTPENSPPKLKAPETNPARLKTSENSPPKLKAPETNPARLKTSENSPPKLKKLDLSMPKQKKMENRSPKEKKSESTSPRRSSDNITTLQKKTESSSPRQKKLSDGNRKIEKDLKDNFVEEKNNKIEESENNKASLEQKKSENNTDKKEKKLTKKKDEKAKTKKGEDNVDYSSEKNDNNIKKTIGEKVKVRRKKQKDVDKVTEKPKKKGRKKKDETETAIQDFEEKKAKAVTKNAGRKPSAIKTKSELKSKVTKQRKQKLPIACRRVKREASLNATMFLNILNEKSPRMSKLDSQRSKSDSDLKKLQPLSINASVSMTNVTLTENDINKDSQLDFIPTGLKSPKNEKVSPIKPLYRKSSSQGKLINQKDLLTPKREPKSPTKTPTPKRKVSFSDDVFEDVFEAVIQRSIEATEKFKTPDKKVKGRKANKDTKFGDKRKKKKDLKEKNKKSKLKTKPDKKEKKFRLKKIKQAIKMTASKSPEEVAEKKRKANLARLERAKELMKTERKVSEKSSVEEKESDDSVSVTSDKEDNESVDQVESETNKTEEVKKVKAKKGALCRSARTHVSVESKTVVENTMPSPRWCECCQSSYYPYQTTQGTQIWRIKHLVDKDSSKSPEPIQSSSNHFIAAHARCEVRPYASPSHVSVIDSNPYVGQIMPHGHIQCSACSCGHSGVFHPGQCQNCTLGGVSNMLPCQRYGGTYSVTYPHTHGSYTHCGCGACYPAGSYHHSVGQTLIHQPQMSMSADSPILLHHPVQLQVTHETSHPVTMPPIPHSHTDSCLTHSPVQPVPLQLSQNEHNLDNLTHMCQLSQGEVTNVSAMASSSPSDHEIDVGSRDDIVKSVPNVLNSSTSSVLKHVDKGLKPVKVKKICTKDPVVKLKRSKSCDISVKGTAKVKVTTDFKVKIKEKKKSNLLLIKQKQKQLEQKSVKFSQKKELKSQVVQNESSSNSKKVKVKSAEMKVSKKDKVKRSISSEQKKEEKAVKEQPKRAWHGWSWAGEGVTKKITNIFDGQIVQRKCYNAIRHDDGDMIQVKDCVLVCSGQKEKDIPYVAKVSNFWEDSVSGEMMMSVLWFYRPEHAEGGPIFGSLENEVFAAKHRDETLVACIEDRGYVLTFNEYCRFMAEVERTKSNLPPRKKVVPEAEESYPSNRIPPVDINPENVFLCRQVYDIKLKRVLKNPS